MPSNHNLAPAPPAPARCRNKPAQNGGRGPFSSDPATDGKAAAAPAERVAGSPTPPRRRAPGRVPLELVRARAEARDARIVEMLRADPTATTLSLSRRAGCSPETVRRALRAAGCALKRGARPGNDNRARGLARAARNEADPRLADEITPEIVRDAVTLYHSMLIGPEAIARRLGVKVWPLCRAMKEAGVVLGDDDPATRDRPAPGAAAAARMRVARSRMDGYAYTVADDPRTIR